jgi:hypothetical protein
MYFFDSHGKFLKRAFRGSTATMKEATGHKCALTSTYEANDRNRYEDRKQSAKD